MSKLVLEAEPRDVKASKAKHLRNDGLIPINIYGKGLAPLSLSVVERQMNNTLHHGGASQLIEVHVAGGGIVHPVQADLFGPGHQGFQQPPVRLAFGAEPGRAQKAGLVHQIRSFALMSR